MKYENITYSNLLEELDRKAALNLVCDFDLTNKDYYHVLENIKLYFPQNTKFLELKHIDKPCLPLKVQRLYNNVYLKIKITNLSFTEFQVIVDILNITFKYKTNFLEFLKFQLGKDKKNYQIKIKCISFLPAIKFYSQIKAGQKLLNTKELTEYVVIKTEKGKIYYFKNTRFRRLMQHFMSYKVFADDSKSTNYLNFYNNFVLKSDNTVKNDVRGEI
ncbi:hypothetical protein [Bombilactobacillus bombi]|uniref:hypothetical protein n=1 Tax=Bombilactobacillus bombi TaxID=1303590 RepID=UPI0035F00D65